MKKIADLRAILFILAALGFQISALLGHWPTAGYIFGFLINAVVVLLIALINHNHRHVSIFQNNLANQALNWAISLVIFSPSSRLHAVHVLNHHLNFQNDDDWSSAKIVANTGQPRLVRSLRYLWVSAGMIRKNRQLLPMGERLESQLISERICIILFSIVMLLVSPKVFLFWYVPSCVIGLFLLLLGNLINHDGADLASEMNHSVDYTNPIENWLLFNNGFHTVHHLRPSMHWTEYPAFHRQVLTEHEQETKKRSLLATLFFQYLRPF